MDGSILGFDEETNKGAIRTENGDRYAFTLEDWNGDRPPIAGDKVDFVAKEDQATEIYLLKGSFTAPDLSGISDKLGTSESRAEMFEAVKSNQAVGMFLQKPHVAGAGLIILGWLFAGHLLIITAVGDAFDAMEQMTEFIKLTGGDTGIGLFRMIGILSLLLFYLIPVFTGWLVYKSFHGQETSKHKRQAAFAGLALPIVVPIIAFIFIFIGLPGSFRSVIMEGGRQAANSGMTLGDLIDIDFPWFLMITGGVLIVLQMMGIVKSFGGSK